MRSATIILSFFAAVWAAMALAALHAPAAVLIAPSLVSAILAVATLRSLPPGMESAEEGRRVGRLLGAAIAGEVAGMLIGVNLVAWAGRPDLSASVVAAVVGLHFLPLARCLPARVYYATAAGLLACAAAGPWLAEPLRDVVVCGGSALTLWATVASFRVTPRRRLAAA